MNSKNLLKVKKFNKIFIMNKYFFLEKNSFVLFKINVMDVHVKFYIKNFFSKYCFKFFYLNKRNYFFYRFKNHNFILIEFKNLEYLTYFLNFDFDFFDPQDSSLVFVALKIKKNVLFYSFLKEFVLEEDFLELIDLFIFFIYFYLFSKKIFLIKINLFFNYIFILNNLLICQQFIKLHLN